MTDSNFVQVQEHFKTQSIDKYFTDQFPTHNAYVIPGHRDKFQDNGRASGGLAQLAKSSLDLKMTRVASSNFRLQAQILHFSQVRILWINGYFPTDPQLVNFDETELQDLLNEVEQIIESLQYDETIFGADFSWDRSRCSGFVSCMDRLYTHPY